MPRHPGRGTVAAGAIAAVAATAALSSAPTSAAGPAPAPGPAPAVTLGEPGGHHDARAVLRIAAPQSRRTTLPSGVLLDLDRSTGTPRMVARLDGFLTRPSRRSRANVVLDYVRAHLADLGLEQADVDSLRRRPTYVDVAGIRHLSWVQKVDGLEIFGHGLQAAVTRNGRLLAVGGSPVPVRLVREAGGGVLATPEQAIAAARVGLGEASGTPGPRDRAREMLFVTAARTYRAWEVLTLSGANPGLSVLDARTGEVLYRRPLTAHEHGTDGPGSRGLVHDYFPGSAQGGDQRLVDFSHRGWLSPSARTLEGNNTHTWSDLVDDDVPGPGEQVGPRDGQDWARPLRPARLGWASFCGSPAPCTWDPFRAHSWQRNRRQAATQAFYFVNNFHDHLAAAPIGFTEGAGNFQVANASGRGLGGDAVLTQTSNGADSGNGFPDGGHVDHASMATPPDGMSPTMELHLQHQPGTSYPAGDPYSPTDTADAADTVYHEYTHGMSNRLVVDAHGNSTLGGGQAGAMGEGWSDWYAADYLVAQRLQPDRPGVADVSLFTYSGAGAGLERTEPLDCQRRSPSPPCDGGSTGAPGGYTYADYGRVVGTPEVHGDGEIWAQTLWDLRTGLGPDTSRALVTRSMELAPHNPSFLDMRNALLLADTALHAAENHPVIWKVFARRGMGFFAGTLGAADTRPGADRHVPPVPVRRASVTGTVRDSGTGAPVAGVPVTLAWQGGAGEVNPSTVTAADGSYRLRRIPVGRYRELVVEAPGYDPVRTAVRVTAEGTVKDIAVRRDWSAASGRAVVQQFSGPDHSPGCGPTGVIDGSHATGWSTSSGQAGAPTGAFVPKQVTVSLPTRVDVTAFAVDPAATCGDGPSASTAGFRIETSPDGSTWTTAAEGIFAAGDRGRLNRLAPVGGTKGVRHVRLWVLSNQTPDFASTCRGAAYSGCSFTGLTELAVYGARS